MSIKPSVALKFSIWEFEDVTFTRSIPVICSLLINPVQEPLGRAQGESLQNCILQTRIKMQTKGKTYTEGNWCRLQTRCKMQPEGKMQTAD